METGNETATVRPMQVAARVSPAGDDMSVLAVLLHVHIDNPAVVLSQRLHKTTEPKFKKKFVTNGPKQLLNFNSDCPQ